MLNFFRRASKASAPAYRRLEHFNPNHGQYFVVNWCLGNLCNYKCTYCPTGLHDGSQPWVSFDTVRKFVGQVRDHYGRDRKYFFEFTGGEVTLHKEFLPLMEYLRENGVHTGIISNGSRALPFWEKARPLLHSICLSFHPQSADPEHFLTVAKFLSETVRVHLNFMMDPDHFYDCYALATRAKDIPNVSIALQPLIVDFGSELYKYNATQNAIFENQRELITKQIAETKIYESFRGTMAKVTRDGERHRQEPHRFISKSENSWKGWSCHAGLEQFVVNMSGWIYRGWCKEGGAIGHVSDANIPFPKAPVICTRGYCHCNFDIMSTKEYRGV